MKMGFIVYTGSLFEMQKEYNELLNKAIKGFGKNVTQIQDILPSFKINTTDLSISFSLSQLFGEEYAIYQIIN